MQPLVDAAERFAGEFDEYEASSVLQAHFGGVPVGARALATCWETFRRNPAQSARGGSPEIHGEYR